MTRDDDPKFAFGSAGLAPFNSLKHTMEPKSICQLNGRLRVRPDHDMCSGSQMFTVWRNRDQVEAWTTCDDRIQHPTYNLHAQD